MWNLVLVLAGNAIVLVLGWWVRKMYPEIPDWALLTTAAFLGFGVIPVAAFERWRRIVFSALTLDLFTRRELRARIEALEKEPATPDSLPKGVDSIGAWAIVDRYIEPALRDKRDPIRLAIRHAFLEEFDKVTGAKLGEHVYNRALLHQWMESNAARFLVENREKMR